MLFDGASTAATASSGITILGLSISDFINAVIAVVAIAGFIASICISVKTLRQTKELNDKTLEETKKLYDKSWEVDMFEKKYSLILYFTEFFAKHKQKEPTEEQILEYARNINLSLLFSEFKSISDGVYPRFCVNLKKHKKEQNIYLTDEPHDGSSVLGA